MTESETDTSKLRVLLTGAAGRIGRHMVEPFARRYALRTFDIQPVPASPDARTGNLQDVPALHSAMEGIDVLVHLAATPDEAPFLENLVPNNIVGLYNTLEAARAASVRRVVFASTCQTVLAYGRGRDRVPTIHASDPPRPSSLYGVTKVFGETLGRWFFDRHGIEFVAIRIGWFQSYENAHPGKGGTNDLWLSPADATDLLIRAIEQEGIGYAIVFGTSITDYELLDRAPARDLLGFEAKDSVASLRLRQEQSRDPVTPVTEGS